MPLLMWWLDVIARVGRRGERESELPSDPLTS